MARRLRSQSDVVERCRALQAEVSAALGRLVLVLDVDGVLKGLAKEEPAPSRELPLRELRRLAAEAGIPGRSPVCPSR